MNSVYSYNEAKARAGYIAAMKEQERVAIRAILSAKRQEIQSEGRALSKELTAQAKEMKDFASKTLPSHLEGAFEGETANAAKDYLVHKLHKPVLDCPIKIK